MAGRYRRYLTEEMGMQEESPVPQKAVNLAFLGGVEVSETFLGIPYRTVRALTTFGELKDTVLALREETGNAFQVSMRYLDKGGTMNKIPTKLTYESALGGAERIQQDGECPG